MRGGGRASPPPPPARADPRAYGNVSPGVGVNGGPSSGVKWLEAKVYDVHRSKETRRVEK